MESYLFLCLNDMLGGLCKYESTHFFIIMFSFLVP